MPTEVVVVGAGGFGRETLDVIEASNREGTAEIMQVVGVIDDRPSDRNLERLTARGYRWLGSIAAALTTERLPRRFALAIGAPAARRQIAEQLESAGWQAVTLIHPSACVGSVASIGAGSIVCGGVQLSTNTRLGRHAHLNPGAIIGHDAELDDFVSVNPGATVSGEVRIGSEVLIGAGATILQGLSVGATTVVGACACITKNVPPGVVAKGVPGRW